MTKGERTKAKIIDNAIVLFSEHGFADTSIQMIADASDLSQAAVLRHFVNKRGLLDAVRSHITKDVVSTVEKRFDPRMTAYETLREYLLGSIDWALKNRAMAQVILLNYYFACHDNDFYEHMKSAVSIAEQRLLAMVLACQREGFLAEERDPEVVAQQVHDFLMGLGMKLLASSRERRLTAAIKERCESFLENLVRP